jgi:hypothetical protein
MPFTKDEINFLNHKLESWESKLMDVQEKIALLSAGSTFVDSKGFILPLDYLFAKARMLELGVHQLRISLESSSSQ